MIVGGSHIKTIVFSQQNAIIGRRNRFRCHSNLRRHEMICINAGYDRDLEIYSSEESQAVTVTSQQWRYGDSNQQLLVCLLSRLSGRISKKNQSSASLAFVRGIHWWPVDSPHKGPVTRKMFPFDDVIMTHVVPVEHPAASLTTTGSAWGGIIMTHSPCLRLFRH